MLHKRCGFVLLIINARGWMLGGGEIVSEIRLTERTCGNDDASVEFALRRRLTRLKILPNFYHK